MLVLQESWVWARPQKLFLSFVILHPLSHSQSPTERKVVASFLCSHPSGNSLAGACNLKSTFLQLQQNASASSCLNIKILWRVYEPSFFLYSRVFLCLLRRQSSVKVTVMRSLPIKSSASHSSAKEESAVSKQGVETAGRLDCKKAGSDMKPNTMMTRCHSTCK